MALHFVQLRLLPAREKFQESSLLVFDIQLLPWLACLEEVEVAGQAGRTSLHLYPRALAPLEERLYLVSRLIFWEAH